MISLNTPFTMNAGEGQHLRQLPTVPFGLYRLSFESRAESPGYWVVFPLDADGNELRADTHSSVYASKDWLTHETCFRGLPDATAVNLSFRARDGAMEVRHVDVTPVSVDWALNWADDLYATLPPVTFKPPAARHQLIPRTMAQLQAGKRSRVVMLGDSISQDTCNSYFDLLVERIYPGADLQLVPSIDGGKGCWYYIDEALFQRYVVDQQPDLLWVGTHSEREGIGPVEKLLRRVRETLDCEVMVVSGPVGDDFRVPEDITTEAACRARNHLPRRRAFAREQAQLCQRLGVEYLDLSNAWLDYLGNSEKTYNWFHRDAGHANDRGKQVIARLVESYFTPLSD